jgi:hypothetical protein
MAYTSKGRFMGAKTQRGSTGSLGGVVGGGAKIFEQTNQKNSHGVTNGNFWVGNAGNQRSGSDQLRARVQDRILRNKN